MPSGVLLVTHVLKIASNAGGGGERVLWAAIRATQQRQPKALCVVYTGDSGVEKMTMLANVKERFNIDIHSHRIVFQYLSTRKYVLASTWPRFTLLGQSLGSLILAADAFHLVLPHVFIDTMGYAFSLALCKCLFPSIATGAYVHYPTISTDMLESLDTDAASGHGIHAGLGTGIFGTVKRRYWQLFARMYSWAGGHIDVVMTNSSWTQAHISHLWTASRTNRGAKSAIQVVFPPVAVQQLEDAIELNPEIEKARTQDILYISQFRPEKNHQRIISAFADFVRAEDTESRKRQSKSAEGKQEPRLILVGSVRDDTDKMLVYRLRVQAQEHGIAERVQFIVNAQWTQVLQWLRTSSVGVNGMWNEHFGIGVVEYQAAGLISVVDDSGGPKADIVVEDAQGRPTGFKAKDAREFSEGFAAALGMSETDAYDMRVRARINAKRFSEEEFERKWNDEVQKLTDMTAL